MNQKIMKNLQVKKIVTNALNNAYFENGFTKVLNNSVDDVTQDLIQNEPTLSNATEIQVFHAVADWQDVVLRSMK